MERKGGGGSRCCKGVLGLVLMFIVLYAFLVLLEKGVEVWRVLFR